MATGQAQFFSGFIAEGRGPNYWEQLKESGWVGAFAYGFFNDLYVLGQSIGVGRGVHVNNLDGTSSVVGSNDQQLSALGGLSAGIPNAKAVGTGLKAATILTVAGRPRVPKGKIWVNLATGNDQKGGTFISLTAKYVEVLKGVKKFDFSKFKTSRGHPGMLPPRVEPRARSKWAKGMELLGNFFDDPQR